MSDAPFDSKDALDAAMAELVWSGEVVYTPHGLIRDAARRFGATFSEARRALKRLVHENVLSFVFRYGVTCVERSFDAPVALSPRVVARPAGCTASPGPGRVAVTIAKGAAFGAGDHPTTRMAVRLIDDILVPESSVPGAASGRVLDVGAGTGMLLLAALALGMPGGIGVDVDPTARSEARANLLASGFRDLAEISDWNGIPPRSSFSLIAANLRPPTLCELAGTLCGMLSPGGAMVLTGMRPDEATPVLSAYAGFGLSPVQELREGGWFAAFLAQIR